MEGQSFRHNGREGEAGQSKLRPLQCSSFELSSLCDVTLASSPPTPLPWEERRGRPCTGAVCASLLAAISIHSKEQCQHLLTEKRDPPCPPLPRTSTPHSPPSGACAWTPTPCHRLRCCTPATTLFLFCITLFSLSAGPFPSSWQGTLPYSNGEKKAKFLSQFTFCPNSAHSSATPAQPPWKHCLYHLAPLHFAFSLILLNLSANFDVVDYFLLDTLSSLTSFLPTLTILSVSFLAHLFPTCKWRSILGLCPWLSSSSMLPLGDLNPVPWF